MRWGDYLRKAQVEERVCVYFSFVWFVYVAMCFPGPTQYVFHTPIARYSLYVLKVPLHTKQTNLRITHFGVFPHLQNDAAYNPSGYTQHHPAYNISLLFIVNYFSDVIFCWQCIRCFVLAKHYGIPYPRLVSTHVVQVVVIINDWRDFTVMMMFDVSI